MTYAWTEVRIQRLEALWLEGHTATEVAQMMGLKSRNQVIGKIHRLGIKRNAPAKPRQPQPKREVKRRVINSAWPKQDVQQLIALWKANKPPKLIAAEMGRTADVVRSKMHKMGLKSGRVTPRRSAEYMTRKGAREPSELGNALNSTPKIKKRPYIADRVAALAEANRTAKGLTIMDLGPRQCRFGTNDPKPGHLHLFCGQKTPAGQSYCEAHAAIVYRAEEEA